MNYVSNLVIQQVPNKIVTKSNENRWQKHFEKQDQVLKEYIKSKVFLLYAVQSIASQVAQSVSLEV